MPLKGPKRPERAWPGRTIGYLTAPRDSRYPLELRHVAPDPPLTSP